MTIAFKTLQDKSLVTISRFGNIHDLIREMGREIVRDQSIENPGEWRHLWDSNDICRVLENDENLANLKSINLRGSKQLIEVPDFSKATSLETVSLSYCANLISIHPSIFTLQELVEVHLNFCQRLENLLAIEELPSSVRRCGKLQYLHLWGCESLKHLYGISKLRYLRYLDLCWCKQVNTSNLHMLFDGLWSLRKLFLNGCCNLYELPENISKLSHLFWLALEETNVKSLPESIKHLSQLRRLYLSKCRRLQSLPEIPASVHFLVANDCTSLERLFTPTRELLEEHNRLCETDANHFCSTTFSFCNCPNLDQDALYAIQAYVNERNKTAKYSTDTFLGYQCHSNSSESNCQWKHTPGS